jgi:hypothetical protein
MLLTSSVVDRRDDTFLIIIVVKTPRCYSVLTVHFVCVIRVILEVGVSPFRKMLAHSRLKNEGSVGRPQSFEKMRG